MSYIHCQVGAPWDVLLCHALLDGACRTRIVSWGQMSFKRLEKIGISRDGYLDHEDENTVEGGCWSCPSDPSLKTLFQT